MNNDVGTLVEPAPVTFTWGAPGWYVLSVGLLLLLVLVAIIIYRHYMKNRYRRSALSWLEQREGALSAQPDQLIYDATMLMKRVAITRYGRRGVADLRDEEWIAFLNKVCKPALFSESDGAWLNKVLYIPGESLNENEVRSFITKTKKWIKDHRYAL
jgi:hypothetical protein